MKCSDVRKKLSAYQDGELNPEGKDRLAGHLRLCSLCREEFQALENTWRVLDGLSEIKAEADFAEGIVRKSKPAKEPAVPPPFRWIPRFIPAPIPALSLSAIGLLIGIYLGTSLMTGSISSSKPEPTIRSEQQFTLASLTDFDPLPPGSLAADYVKMMSSTEDRSR